jgi:TonB-dependent starch-binding outer membrane protein SusC
LDHKQTKLEGIIYSITKQCKAMHLTAIARSASCRSGLTKSLSANRRIGMIIRVMKLMAILLLAAALQVSARSAGQTVTLSEKDATLEKLFREIRRQTGYNFLYNDAWLGQTKRVTIQVSNASLTEALNICFKDQPFTYSIVEHTIVVKRISTLVIQSRKPSLTEDLSPLIDVKGRIVDSTGAPVVGASVTIKGNNTRGTTTDAAGFFSLNVNEGDVILVSFIGYEMRSVIVTSSIVASTNTLVITLKHSITKLEEVEVVVNTGYQQIPKERATGDFTFITQKQLDERVASNIIEKLEWTTNGLVFNKKASDGSNMLRIRGESTIYANAEPLIVVDNFPYDGDINNINPNDVESITVLKDAGAASIWGPYAGNGVIVITTKKGRYSKPISVEANANITVAEEPDLFYWPKMSISDYIDFEKNLFDKGHYNSRLIDIHKSVVSPVVDILNAQRLGNITTQDATNQLNALRGYDIRNDLRKYIYQKPVSQQYQVNIRGGGDKTTYYFSAGFDKGLARVKGNESKRITLNTQSTYKPVKSVEFRFGLTYSENSITSNGIEDIPNLYPYMQLADANGNFLAVPQHRKAFEDTIMNRGFLDWRYIPLQERNLIDNQNTRYDIRTVTGIKIDVLPGLKLDALYQYQKSQLLSKSIGRKESYGIRDRMNTFAILNNGLYIGSNFPNGGIMTQESENLISNSFRVSLNYALSKGKHDLNSITGFEVREVKKESNSVWYYGFNPETGSFIVPDLYKDYPLYPSGNVGTIGGSSAAGLSFEGNLDRFTSFYHNSSYTYSDRYTFSGSARFDGSNYFGVKTNKKTVPLWSAGFKWAISKEKFYHFSTFPTLNLRITYGYQGNLNRNVTAVTTMRYRSGAPYTGLPFAVIINTPNPELRWEKTGMLNIGLDFMTASKRISGSVAYYRRNGVDLIGDAPLDPTTGVTQIRGNFSGMRSKGVDLNLMTKNIDTKFQWGTTFIFNYAAETVTKYDIPVSAVNYLGAYGQVSPQVGKPLYRVYSYYYGGLDANGNPRIYLGDTLNKKYDGTNSGLIKQSDLHYSGRANPPVTGSMVNTFSYAAFTMKFTIAYKLNYYFRRRTISYNALTNDGWETSHSDYAQRWQNPGDENLTGVPAFVYGAPVGRESFYAQSDALVEKGDHIRLQFVNLSYNFNRNILKKLSLKSGQVYFYVNNLNLMIWRANDKNIDPDYPFVAYPPSRSYSLGVRFNL